MTLRLTLAMRNQGMTPPSNIHLTCSRFQVVCVIPTLAYVFYKYLTTDAPLIEVFGVEERRIMNRENQVLPTAKQT